MATKNKERKAAIVISLASLRKLDACRGGLWEFERFATEKGKSRFVIKSGKQFAELAEKFYAIGVFSWVHWLIHALSVNTPIRVPKYDGNNWNTEAELIENRKQWATKAIDAILRHKQKEMDKRHAKRKAI